jgi:hypothetical protein
VVDLDLDQRRRREVISKSGVETEKTAAAGGRDEPEDGGGGVIEHEELSRFRLTCQDRDRDRGQREERQMVLEGRNSTPSYYVSCR